MGKGKGGGKKGQTRSKSSSCSAEAKNIFAQAQVSISVVSKNDSLFPSANLGDADKIVSHLEWSVQKDVLLIPRQIENASLTKSMKELGLESELENDEVKYLAMIQSKSRPIIPVRSSPLNLEDAQIILEAIANARLDAAAAASINESERIAKDKNKKKSAPVLSSEDRYTYWTEFCKFPAINEGAKALIDSKGLKWRILEGKERPVEFPDNNVDGSVNSFLKRNGECDLLILRRRGPFDKVFLDFDVKQQVGLAAWQSATAQGCLKELQDHIIEATHPSRFTKYCTMVKDSKPVFQASNTIDVTDLFNAFSLATGGSGESECGKCKTFHSLNKGTTCDSCFGRVCDKCNFQQKIKCYNAGSIMKCCLCDAKIEGTAIQVGNRVVRLEDTDKPPEVQLAAEAQ
mmetsp:Transcript_6310/g.8281  ORF Transcript_6310/g.8281 Transcript_6310/m.8281 type:complete len:403 (+) Transcript_6310:24-1232(+)